MALVKSAKMASLNLREEKRENLAKKIKTWKILPINYSNLTMRGA